MNATEDSIEINGQTIKANYNIEGIRYLGVYINNKLSKKAGKIRINKIIISAIRQMSWKKLTDKQIIYMWNNVLVPAIEYQMQMTILSKHECKTLMRPVKKLIKRKMNLSIASPDTILYSDLFLNVTNIYDRQVEHYASTMLYKLNSKGEMGISTRIRLDQIKKKEMIFGCVLENINSINRRTDDIIIKGIKILEENNFRMCNHLSRFKHMNKKGRFRITDILNKETIKKSKISIKSTESMFVEDIITEDNKIKSWIQICNENRRNARGQILKWYLEAKTILTNDNDDNVLVGIYSDLGKYKKDSLEKKRINYSNSKENWDKFEREFITEDIDNMNIINRMILEIDNIWGRFKNIGTRLAAIDNEKITIASVEARKLYSIMEKMNSVKMKVVKRRRWKIRNINYIKRLLDITESKNIFWRLEESIEKGKLMDNSITSKWRSEKIDINEIEELILINRYSLYWNRKLINNQIRDTVKKYKLKYLGEWLTLNINKKLITNLDVKEINWVKMIEYINNKREGGITIISDKNKRDRSYNLKNLIEQLPTYKVMTRRNNEIYDVKLQEIDNQIIALQQENISINREKWHHRIIEILIK
ncbi:hypothetical protein C1645_840170 [Glomus cerebriforme]|uniref:Uncharacterized protein n=1 Tax=Glomus cerebriforme TaxID=658196 RepID=A0A397RZK9_9GLOM|nr:hypothetical protein C1645_840170 [Glomus cerebriforme]